VAIKNKQHQTELFWKTNDGSGIKYYNLFWCEQAFGNLCKVNVTYMLHIIMMVLPNIFANLF
jgi:hypothetical protein